MNFTNLLQHEIEAKTKRIAFELLVAHGDYRTVNRQAFQAQSASVLRSIKTADQTIVTEDYIQNSFSFCRKAEVAENCSLLTFHIQSAAQEINRFFTQMKSGSCNNYIKLDSW
jgi:hypothetical protein